MTNPATRPNRWASRPLALLITLALAVGGAIVGVAPAALAATTYTVGGTLTGKTAAGTSVPLEGVYVYLYVKKPSTSYFTYANAGAYTTATGAYSITAPGAGEYTLHYNYCSSPNSSACKPGYTEGYRGGADSLDKASSFTLTSAAPTNVSNLQVEAGSTITGTVRDSAGAAIAGARVSANQPSSYNGPSATTNSAGVYTISRASSKNTIIEASYYDDAASNKLRKFYNTIYWKNGLSAADATPLALTVGSTKSAVDFTLTQAPSIHGRAVDSSGAGIANLGYVPYVLRDGEWEGPQSGPNLTDADGWFARQVSPNSSNKIAFFDDLGSEGAPVTRTVPFETKFYQNAATIADATVITVGTGNRVVLSDTALAPFSGAIRMAGDYRLTDQYSVGNEVYADGVLFSPQDVTTTRQWYRDNVAISGATDYSYTWVAADKGAVLTQKVTAKRTGSTTATFTSRPYQVPGAALTATPVPTITGTAKVGSKLTASAGTWTPAPVTLGYSWLRDGKAISGATSSTYTLGAADLGAKISVAVKGTKTGYVRVTKTSAPTVAVVENAAVITGTTPKISGSAKVGQLLTATAGAWAPADVTLTYAWYRSGTAISGATSSTYTTTSSDLAKTITVKVTGSKTGLTSVSKTSAATAKIASGTLTAATPVLSGNGRVGSAQKITVGTWGPGTVTKKYQWYVAGAAVSGATSSSFTPPSSALGKTIKVKVTGSKTGYTTVSKVSATVTVAKGAFTVGTPSVSGKAAVATVLTAKVGTWVPATGNTYSYQWYKRTSVDGSPTAISGATASKYTVRSADKGSYLSVKVTAKRTAYTSLSASSAPTSVVLAKAVQK